MGIDHGKAEELFVDALVCLGAFPVEGEDCLGRTKRPVVGHSHCNAEATLRVIRGRVPNVGSRSLE